jgi:hypothetical protein
MAVCRISISCVALLYFCPGICAEQYERNERPAACDQYDKIDIPDADLPTQEDRAALASCKSEDLYFGFDHPAEPATARKCAYLEREREKLDPRTAMQMVFGGPGLLTMIYANGKGATRNFDLALKFSCEVDGAAAENAHRFRHLLELKNGHWTGDDFNLCDDATSGFMQGWCADLQERFEKVKREQRISEITARWTADEMRAFEKLEKAANGYFQASSQNEVDLSGTGRAAFEIEAEAALNDRFVAALERFEKGEFPGFTASDFSKTDAALNSTYGKIQSAPTDTIGPGTVTRQGIREAESAWLVYREAWVNFASVKYPKVPPEAWRAWLTTERLKSLQGLS